MKNGHQEKADPVWCVVANAVMERQFGHSGEVLRRSGTKHFAPGAKVFLVDAYWGMGGESVIVVGRHRKSHRFVEVAMKSRHLANWRVTLAYSPHVISRVIDRDSYHGTDPRSEEGRAVAEYRARYFAELTGKTQPFILRPPVE